MRVMKKKKKRAPKHQKHHLHSTRKGSHAICLRPVRPGKNLETKQKHAKKIAAKKLHTNLKTSLPKQQKQKSPGSYTAEIDLLMINNVPADKVFYLCDGRVIRNLLELADLLETMDDSVFAYHSNDFKNDFANWVSDVIGDAELADELKLAQDKDKAHIAVLRHLLRKVLPAVKKERKMACKIIA